MQNHPQPREIPAGKILIAEYGDLDASNKAQRETIAEKPHGRLRSNVRLVWSSPGFEVAGSAARWTNGYWAVLFDLDGATHGKRYQDEDAARERFASMTETGGQNDGN